MSKPYIDQFEIPLVMKKTPDNIFTLMSKNHIMEGETINIKMSQYDKNKVEHVVVEIIESRDSKGVWSAEIPKLTICKLEKA